MLALLIYHFVMTKLDRALTRLASLPRGRQDEIAEVIEQIMDMDEAGGTTPSWQVQELKSRLASPDDFADDAEIEAVFAAQ